MGIANHSQTGAKESRSSRVTISVAEALRQIKDNITPVTEAESIDVTVSSGRVLARDVYASMSIPLYNRAAKDGWAVRSADIAGATESLPVKLVKKGSVTAGSMPGFSLSEGECASVATGFILPDGSDTVVMLEHANYDEHGVNIARPLPAGANIAARGCDIRKGELILEAGTILDPGKTGALASQGLRTVEVYAKPVVSILSSGDEIMPPGSSLGPGQIYDINSSALSALVMDTGATPRVMGIVSDRLTDITKEINQALSAADMVIITGGSSVGEKDLAIKALGNMGEIVFHGVRIKPGRPVALAKVCGKPVFVLPGPPSACLANAWLLVVPAIRYMAMTDKKMPYVIRARLKLGKKKIASGVTNYFTVRLEGDNAIPVFKKAGDITSTSLGDGYVVIGEDELVSDGTEVEVRLF
jgi:molybdenum cofactor synthesis domain-containing protein